MTAADFLQSFFRQAVRALTDLPPGQALTMSRQELRFVVVPDGWVAADWLLESVIGSAYVIRTTTDPVSKAVTFHRLGTPLTDGRYTYISPERRDRVRQDRDGYFVPLERA